MTTARRRRGTLGPALGTALAALIAAGSVFFHGPAAAQPASSWASNDHAGVRLLSASEATGDQKTLSFGLEFRLAPQWKIYWRSPGDAGFPPRIDWSGSNNLADVDIAWPAPRRYTIFGLSTFVYSEAVVLPLMIKPRETGAPLGLRAKIDYLLCDKICIPYEAELRLDLAAGEAKPTIHAPLIASFQAKVPPRADAANPVQGLSIERTALTRPAGPGARHATLEVLARSAAPFEELDLLVEGPAQLTFGRPEIHLSEGDRLALLRVSVGLAGTKPVWPAAPQLTLTLTDAGRAMEQDVLPTVSETDSGGLRDSTLLGMLALALLGGLILNVMPCVLPVLSLKLLGAINRAGQGASAVRAGFLATSAGIIVSLLALGLGVIALKAAGLSVGWGVQFQQPIFLAAMAVILVLFAANLWGLFAIGLPGAVGDAAMSARATRPDLTGDFLTGVFATLLATPCSAPFLGTAVGFALTRGAGEILAIFAALGVGLALPYLLVAAMPRIARLLPRPGPWMIWLRRILGLALVVTAAWLITVLNTQLGIVAALVIAGLLAAILLLLLWRARAAEHRGIAAMLAGVLAVLAIGAPWAAPMVAPDSAGAPARSNLADRAWQPFDRVQIFNAVAQGTVVLVDVTADWCITCQANKTLVLDRGELRRRIETGAILALRADWTRPDPAIADYLASFGRYGIPFNAVYGPGAPAGIALPELLTAEAVLAAVNKAAAPPPRVSAGR